MGHGRKPARHSGAGIRAMLAVPIALWLTGGCGRIEYAQSGPDGTADGAVLDGALARDGSAAPGEGGVDGDASGIDAGELDASSGADAGVCSPATCAWGCSGARCGGPIAIAGGARHACAALGTGQVACWGQNARGELGDGTTTRSAVPLTISGLGDVVQLALGRDFSCARHASGSVSCWGSATSGQLGDGTTVDRSTPGPVSDLPDAIDIAAYESTACAVRASGAVVCWGVVPFNQAGDCVSGSVNGTSSPVPMAIAGIADARAIAVGSGFRCALLVPGTVSCWGSNLCGQLGTGDTVFRSAPVTVGGALTGAVEIAAGGRHVCARLPSGEVRCWGENQRGQLGDGTTVDRLLPTVASELTPAEQLSHGGQSHTCILRASGAVTCRGDDTSGQRGDGSSATPSDVEGLIDATFVGAGLGSGYAIRGTGDALAWGRGSDGQLGDDTLVGSIAPVSIVAP